MIIQNMPELPEVETTRLSFADRIAGARITHVRMGSALRWPLGCEPSSLTGRQVLRVRRRGKYLLLDLSQGVLLIHLGMSGSLSFTPLASLERVSSTADQSAASATALGRVGSEPFKPAGKHDHFDLLTTQGLLRLHDPRRFGAVVYAEAEDTGMAQKLLRHLGPEPLEPSFTVAVLRQGLAGKKAAIKQVLLAGEAVVGVGNIYASEALFLAGIRPTTAAGRIGPERVARLHQAIVSVLNLALGHGGSTLRNFSNAHGDSGFFQLHVKVYDRAGEPCQVCGSPIKHLMQGQRATYFCGTCQRP
jgi:formamidopyrimidine-DNA glycosylase